MSILNSIFPKYTYRRLFLSLIAGQISGRVSLKNRIIQKNIRYYIRYKSKTFTCNVCGNRTLPFFDFPDLKLREEHKIGELRETLQCIHCGATMRHRVLASAILKVVSEKHGSEICTIIDAKNISLAGLKVLDTDSYSPISLILCSLPNYIRSSFVPDGEFDQEIQKNHFNINLERMGFLDKSFDIVLTSDVAEHIRNIDAAHQEIFRVLRLNGSYIFTVPFDPKCPTHHLLVDTTSSEDIFLVPKQIHGDPISGGILAYRVFGKMIFDDLMKIGFTTNFFIINEADSLIIDGDVFVSKKLKSDSEVDVL